MNALTQPKLTLEAYLAWEDVQPEKHEFRQGEVFTMDALLTQKEIARRIVEKGGTSS